MKNKADLLKYSVDKALSEYMQALRREFTPLEKLSELDQMTPEETQPLVRAVLGVKLKVKELVETHDPDSATIEYIERGPLCGHQRTPRWHHGRRRELLCAAILYKCFFGPKLAQKPKCEKVCGHFL